MTDRTTLALAACAGLTDAELAERGPQGFKKMRDRKRQYATAARMLAKGMELAEAKIADLQKQLDAAKKHAAALEQLDAPVTDTTQAANLLAALGKTTK
jgi:hypothetical protein